MGGRGRWKDYGINFIFVFFEKANQPFLERTETFQNHDNSIIQKTPQYTDSTQPFKMLAYIIDDFGMSLFFEFEKNPLLTD